MRVRWLALSFLLVPFVELWLLLKVGDVLGFWPTLAIVLGTAFLGALLAKREGLRVLHTWRRSLAEMRLPEEGVTSGLLVLVGAVLLISPGVLTDVLGIGLLVPPVRRAVARRLEHRLREYVSEHGSFQVRVMSPTYRGARDVVDVEGRLIDER